MPACIGPVKGQFDLPLADKWTVPGRCHALPFDSQVRASLTWLSKPSPWF